MKRLTRNRARCSRCDSVIESTSCHDLVQCACRRCFVDGGLEYRRSGDGDGATLIDMSEWSDEE